MTEIALPIPGLSIYRLGKLYEREDCCCYQNYEVEVYLGKIKSRSIQKQRILRFNDIENND